MRSLILDTNLLLLLAVGTFDINLVGRKRLDIFLRDDFELLRDLLDTSSRWLTTPHVLAELNNLADQCVPRSQHDVFRQFLGQFFEWFDERWLQTQELSNTAAFRRLGLTDAAVVQLADSQTLVLSVDLELCSLLWGRGINAQNFHHLRQL
ncbi:MAG: hypothetical protein JO353_14130 [Phycisphaerae bacterium]|nr:hypothetical protein [Phycisphaerae bacterium]